jgi:hypothetical protein
MDDQLAVAAVLFILSAGFSAMVQAEPPSGEPPGVAQTIAARVEAYRRTQPGAGEAVAGGEHRPGAEKSRCGPSALPLPGAARSPRASLPANGGSLRPRAGGGR